MNSIDKKITIITPCHNSEKFLMDCWSSIKSQTIGLESLICIFVDDASTDSTWDMILKIEKEAPDSVIAIHLDENLRQGGARNAALEYVSTPYVQFLDSDDCLCYNACENLYRYAREYNADLIQFGQQHYYETVEPSLLQTDDSNARFFKINGIGERRLFINSGIISYCHSNKLYRTELLRKSEVHFAEKKIFEEPPFVYPLLFYAENIVLVRQPFYMVRLHSESTMSKDKNLHFYDLPSVQYELLRFMLNKEDVYPVFKSEINAYFIWSYYVLTIMSAYQQQGVLELEYFQYMQKLCRMLGAEWALNPNILTYGKNAIDVISSMNYEFRVQEELDDYINSSSVKDLYAEIVNKRRIVPNILISQAKKEMTEYETAPQNENGPYVSIILTTYNRASILPMAIKSILEQTYKRFELIIVDDCSTDSTESVVMVIKDERIRYIRNEVNCGPGGSRNVGIKAAKYDLIAFEDDDDIWHKDKLQKQVSLMTVCDDRIGLVYCEYEKKEKGQSEGRVIPDRNLNDEYKSGYLFPFLLNRNVVGADTALIRKKVFERVGYFRDDLPCLEDWELFLRISREYYLILFPEVLLDVNITPGSVTFKETEIQRDVIRQVQRNYNDDFKRLNISRL